MNLISKRLFRYKWLLLCLAVLLAAGYFGLKRDSNEIQYKTTAVQRGSIRAVIQATGSLEAVEKVDVGTQISGTIAQIYIDYNSAVKQGQLIAEIDSATQETEVAQASANLLAAKADLRNAEAVLDKAAKALNRTRRLAAKDLVATADVDADESSYLTAEAQAASAQAKIEQYEAALAKAKLNLGYTKIYSPVDGVVVAKSVEKGQTVAASYSTPSIAEIARDLKQMQVAVSVDEADIGGVKQGQKAEFSVDAYADRKFYGEVTQVRLSPTTSDNVVTYTVIVTVANPDGILLPGMTANVALIVQQKDNILFVPNSAFRFKPVDANAALVDQGPPGKATVAEVTAPAVYILDKKAPLQRQVEKGISDGQNTEVVSGLEEAEQVIIGILVAKEGT
ncbi:MAG: efflux RND transporter periplasmic adaptor subunit [Sporomusaceae bacterium]|nr:efflux RND transporter periplasmic adaptor subunit [Sporomusaceae bacterium]